MAKKRTSTKINPITALVTLPEEAAHYRVRTDFSTIKSALAKPFFKSEFFFNFVDQQGVTLDSSTDMPPNLFFMQYGLGPHCSIRWWNTNVLAQPYSDTDTITDVVAAASSCYQMIFYQQEDDKEVDLVLVPPGPVWKIDLKFKGMKSVSGVGIYPAVNAEAVYDTFQYSHQYRGYRYFYVDSNKKLNTNNNYNAICIVEFGAAVPVNSTVYIRVYRFGQGAEVLEFSGTLVGDNSKTFVIFQLPGEQHDFYRVELFMANSLGPTAAPVGFATSTPCKFFVLGYGSALNCRNMSGYEENEKFVQSIKNFSHSCLLSNDQADFFKNGTIYASQITGGDAWPWWLQLASQGLGSLSNFTAQISDEDDSVTLNASNGIYSFIKPTSTKEMEFQRSWVNSEGQVAGGGSHVHTDEWTDMENFPTFIQIAVVVNPIQITGATPTYLSLRGKFFQPCEYRTDNQWADKSEDTLSGNYTTQALEQLRKINNFSANDIHLKQIGGALKKLGLVATIGGAAITPVSGPIGAGVAGAGVTAAGLGELIDILED